MIFVGILVIWSLVGFLLIVLLGAETVIDDGSIDFLDPKWIYENLKVNWFGATMLTLIFNLTSPLLSTAYWIYRLCTNGRR